MNPVRNEEILSPRWRRSLSASRFEESTGAEPCLDELEVWSGEPNTSRLPANGTKAAASGTLPGYEIHKLEHINDGRVGNSRSWISSEAGRGWVQLEFPRPERIDKIVWGRDREGQPSKIDSRPGIGSRRRWRRTPGNWLRLRMIVCPTTAKAPSPPGPVYRFDGFTAEEAEPRQGVAGRLAGGAEATRRRSRKPPMVYAGTFSQPGPTFRFNRGDPMQPREAVPPATLALFHPLPWRRTRRNRSAGLRSPNWITDPQHPLTARVMVNRLWQYQFGTGLVDTPNDFGKNGSRPTHPELLDWLATEFIAQGWSIKAVQREILTSATWRQSSAPRKEALKMDGKSRLLWRFPPRRLEAEAIRDSILAVSGTLDRTMGGPSFFLHDVNRENVYHYHPKEEFGPAESRRMVYAFKVRMEQDGIFGAFDCPDGSLVMPETQHVHHAVAGAEPFQQPLHPPAIAKIRGAAAAGRRPRCGERRCDAPGNWLSTGCRTRSKQGAAISFAKAEGLTALCRAVLNANELLFIP